MILELLRHYQVTSQSQLVELLKESGITVAQATLSRDLEELDVRKVRGTYGQATYVLGEDPGRPTMAEGSPRQQFELMFDRLAVKVDSSGPFAVIRTWPGGAEYLASYLDRANLKEVAGCIAGNDTIVVLAHEPLSGDDLTSIFRIRR